MQNLDLSFLDIYMYNQYMYTISIINFHRAELNFNTAVIQYFSLNFDTSPFSILIYPFFITTQLFPIMSVFHAIFFFS